MRRPNPSSASPIGIAALLRLLSHPDRLRVMIAMAHLKKSFEADLARAVGRSAPVLKGLLQPLIRNNILARKRIGKSRWIELGDSTSVQSRGGQMSLTIAAGKGASVTIAGIGKVGPAQ